MKFNVADDPVLTRLGQTLTVPGITDAQKQRVHELAAKRRLYLQTTLQSAKDEGQLNAIWEGIKTTAGRFKRSVEGITADLINDEDWAKDVVNREAAAQQNIVPYREVYPSTHLGEMAPYFIGPYSAGVKTAVGMGALHGALDAGITGAKDAAYGAALGGVLSGATQAGINRVFNRKVTPTLDQEDLGLLNEAQNRLGFKATPGMLAPDTRGAKEASWASNPAKANIVNKPLRENQLRANRLAAKEIGLTEDVTRLTPRTLQKAHTQIGNQFEEALEGWTIDFGDDELANIFKQGLDNIARTPKVGKTDRLDRVIKELFVFVESKRALSGKEYQSIRSDLGKMARQALRGENSDPIYAHALEQAIATFDDVAEMAIITQPGKENLVDKTNILKDARRKWKILHDLERPNVIDAKGNLNLSTLHRKANLEHASPDLSLAGQFGATFKTQVPDSGTATRLSEQFDLNRILGGGAAGGLLGIAGDIGDPLTNAVIGSTMLPLAVKGFQKTQAGIGMHPWNLPQALQQRFPMAASYVIQPGLLDEHVQDL
jgi:hypothetical protein